MYQRQIDQSYRQRSSLVICQLETESSSGQTHRLTRILRDLILLPRQPFGLAHIYRDRIDLLCISLILYGDTPGQPRTILQA